MWHETSGNALLEPKTLNPYETLNPNSSRAAFALVILWRIFMGCLSEGGSQRLQHPLIKEYIHYGAYYNLRKIP